jgi:CHAD domain-containing protein
VTDPTVQLGLSDTPLTASADDPPAVHVRAKLDEQLRALLEHEPIARVGTDPEGVHQMRVGVRRMRAALKAEGSSLGAEAGRLQGELKWLGSSLGAVRDLDVQLEHMRAQAEGFEPDERAAVEDLLKGLLADRRRARQRMLGTFRSRRYSQLLESLAAAIHTEPADNGKPVSKKQRTVNLVDLVKRPFRKLIKDVSALGDDPPDDDLHALRIRGKRLRYAAELAVPVGGKPVKELIKSTKVLQELLGDHQDAVIAEELIRALVSELTDPINPDVVFVAGRLVERERARRADCRARWRAALDEVDAKGSALLAD